MHLNFMPVEVVALGVYGLALRAGFQCVCVCPGLIGIFCRLGERWNLYSASLQNVVGELSDASDRNYHGEVVGAAIRGAPPTGESEGIHSKQGSVVSEGWAVLLCLVRAQKAVTAVLYIFSLGVRHSPFRQAHQRGIHRKPLNHEQKLG